MDVDQTFKEGSAAFDADEFKTALAKLIPLADEGHATAEYLLAEMYRWGNGIEQNAEKAFHFYKAAADQGHPTAAFNLWLLLLPGGNSAPDVMQSLPKDADASKRYLDVAVVRFKELAEGGDMEAMNYLGFLFHSGLGVALDGAEAIRWYTTAFEAGGYGAANNLALVHYEGDIRVRDKAKALFWYMKTKEFNCQCIGINEFESLLSSDASKPTGWTIPGYEISMRRVDGVIPLSEWEAAVRATEGVRLCIDAYTAENPRTGEVICVPAPRGEAEIFFPETKKWIPVFRWCPSSGDITFPLIPEFFNPDSALARTARELAQRLGAQLIGDGGKVFE